MTPETIKQTLERLNPPKGKASGRASGRASGKRKPINWFNVSWEEEFNTFLSSRGYSKGKQRCPHQSSHTKQSTPLDFTCELSDTTTYDGFRLINGSCWHRSCLGPIKGYMSRINKEWSKYLIDNVNNELPLTPEQKENIARRRQEAFAANEEAIRIEKQVLEQLKMFENVTNEQLPTPPYDNHSDEFVAHLSLFNEGEVIFLGTATDSYNALLTLNEDNLCKAIEREINFTCGSVFQSDDACRRKLNVKEHRYTVLEMDDEPDKRKQWNNLLCVSRNISPMILCVDSGGKSLHGWFKSEAILPYKTMLTRYGYDPATMRISQPVRMAGCYRSEKEKWQRLIYINN